MATEALPAAGELLRALNHTTRLRILRLFEDAGPAAQYSPVTIADELELDLGVVAYHVRHLAAPRRGVLELAATRQVRGATEHLYRATDRGRQALDVIRAIVNQPEASDAR
jgi:predicted ArsR family transcriptional regulator